MPTSCAVYKMAGCMVLFSFVGGVVKTISMQPAIFAGIPNINTVEKRSAVPPGIYKPTFSIATDLLQHFIPGIVSMISVCIHCFSRTGRCRISCQFFFMGYKIVFMSLYNHFFNGNNQYSLGPRFLQLLNNIPEIIFLENAVHTTPSFCCQRQNCGTFHTG